eukprot:TRINITY_DN22584_c0_g1_i1.p1 TRINITY_DN22584_c0_g1~~TRINITY_DN22584_c0_g1_i1.p1  ORF type:complete len:222 (-),score=37.78 TRINITY_DN22584_c0_g1_i1:388-1053(-)
MSGAEMESNAQPKKRVEFQEPAGAGVGDELTRSSSSLSMETQEAFMGVKSRRRSSMNRLFKADYINVGANETVMRLLSKYGDKEVFFADHVVKVNRKIKMRRRICLVTNSALYLLDAEFFGLKRRVPLPIIGRLCLSELSDNFFAVIVPNEYDTLLASTRKTEIVTALVETTKKLSSDNIPVEVLFSNSFQYLVDAESPVELQFEEVEDGVKTKFATKGSR